MDLKVEKHYLNLTNGIEYLDTINRDYKFVRIQSTYCEQRLWNYLLQDLDYNFLMDLALGYKVIVYDTSQHKNKSRALYQGLEFIKYILNRVWFNNEINPIVKGTNCRKYFNQEYNKLEERTINKIKYFRKFLIADNIDLDCECMKTIHDRRLYIL